MKDIVSVNRAEIPEVHPFKKVAFIKDSAFKTGFELRSQPVSFHALLMLPEHWPAASFAASALAGGVRVTPAAMFATDRAHAPNAVRISVAAAADRAALAEALGVLAALLRGGRAPTRAVV
jgi:DNA-binding transcriptional MocR family regulator